MADIKINGDKYFQVRKHPMILLERLIFNELIFFLIYFALRWAYYNFPYDSFSIIPDLEIYLFLSTLLIHIVNIFSAVWITLFWSSNYYIITPKDVTVRRGVFYTYEKAFSIDKAESVTYRQGFWGKVFNYGTVKVFSPALREDIFIRDIPSPEKFAELLRTHTDATNSLFRFIPQREP
jgi:uncharacterized membrane protein YdbT with pleckstrin-like domain